MAKKSKLKKASWKTHPDAMRDFTRMQIIRSRQRRRQVFEYSVIGTLVGAILAILLWPWYGFLFFIMVAPTLLFLRRDPLEKKGERGRRIKDTRESCQLGVLLYTYSS